MTGKDDDGWRASADAWVREQGEHVGISEGKEGKRQARSHASRH